MDLTGLDKILAVAASGFIGVWGYMHKRTTHRIDLIEKECLPKTDAKELIGDKLAPLYVHLNEIRSDIKEIKADVKEINKG